MRVWIYETSSYKVEKRLDGFVHENFRTIRVTEKIYTELEKNCFKKADLKSKTHLEGTKEMEVIEESIAKKYSEDIYQKFKSELNGTNCEDGGGNPRYI